MQARTILITEPDTGRPDLLAVGGLAGVNATAALNNAFLLIGTTEEHEGKSWCTKVRNDAKPRT